MKIIASYILHYGVEWLYWSMRSVAPCVDEIRLFYSTTPSHGHATSLPNPETRDMLYDEVLKFSSKHDTRIVWYEAHGFEHEGKHREWAVNTCQKDGADLVLVVDADELWDRIHLMAALEVAKRSPLRTHRVYMRHFWRSLKWVCNDGAAPTRIIRPDAPPSEGEGYVSGAYGYVYHMGYAQSPEIVMYKQSIHGHKAEWRPGWYENTFMPWKPGMGDVHPTSVNYWYPVRYEDNGELELLCGDHPYFTQDIIDHPFYTQNPYSPAR